MLKLNNVHHIAIICADYQRSKKFYTEVLGLNIVQEIFRAERNSYKLDLALGNDYSIELFSFPDPPKRLSQPESTGLRHLAFEVSNIQESVDFLKKNGVLTEPIRIDEFTGKEFTFFYDPDQLPMELCQK